MGPINRNQLLYPYASLKVEVRRRGVRASCWADEKRVAHVGWLVDRYCSHGAAHRNPMILKEMRLVSSRARRQATSFPT